MKVKFFCSVGTFILGEIVVALFFKEIGDERRKLVSEGN
jgi:hypothetical protein